MTEPRPLILTDARDMEQPVATYPRRTMRFLAAAACVWLALILSALGFVEVHSNSAGEAAKAPVKWPAASGVRHSATRPTLLMFAHPQCPCTMASLTELETLMARYHGQVEADVVILNSPGVNVPFSNTRLMAKAAHIPGVDVVIDNGGFETGIFAAKTSGTVLLYSPEGVLMFDGGITIARGHEGDNGSLDALSGLLGERAVGAAGMGLKVIGTPVFGCELTNSKCEGSTVCTLY